MKEQIVENKKRPWVCISDFTLSYVEKKHMPKIKSKDLKRAREAREKYVKEHKFVNHPITLELIEDSLEEKYRFPTKKTEQRVLQSAWRVFNKKNNFESFVMYIKNISVKHKSQVSYDFNYKED